LIASRLSTDGSFDQDNYHLYNGFAVVHDVSSLDIVPAQLQTLLYYGLDVVYYMIFRYLNDRPLPVNLMLSIPYSLAALAVLIARLFATPSHRWPVPHDHRGNYLRS
jgi:hypothetical protein